MGASAYVSAEKTKNFGGRAGERHELVFMISLVISLHNCLETYNQPVFPFWAVRVSVTQRHCKQELRKREGSWEVVVDPKGTSKQNPFVMSVPCCSCAQRSCDLSKTKNTFETIILTECMYNYWILWCVICGLRGGGRIYKNVLQAIWAAGRSWLVVKYKVFWQWRSDKMIAVKVLVRLHFSGRSYYYFSNSS